MSEHLDTHGLELFIAHKLPPDELLLAARHIGVCQSCRERIAQGERTGERIESLRAELTRDAKSVEQHLEYEQLEAYVDDRLDQIGREIAGNHLAVCASCARDARELETLRTDLLQPARQSKTTAGLHSEHARQRFRLPLGLSPRIAWAAALLITIAAAILVVWSRGRTPQVANNNSGNSPDVVNNNSVNPPEVPTKVGRNPPGLVNNHNLNANGNAADGGPGNRNDSADAYRRETVAPNVNPDALVLSYEAVIKRALETQRIERAPVLKGLGGRPSTLMSGSPPDAQGPGSEGANFALVQPVGTVTLSNRPTFKWRPLAGATSYKVHVLDTDFTVVAESGAVTGTSWSPPTALERGVVYLWQVSAAKDGQVISVPAAPRPEARFRILTESKAREVRQAVNERAGSHLALGIIYAHTGLLDDAEREFQAALSRSQEADTARKLLKNVGALRR